MKTLAVALALLAAACGVRPTDPTPFNPCPKLAIQELVVCFPWLECQQKCIVKLNNGQLYSLCNAKVGDQVDYCTVNPRGLEDALRQYADYMEPSIGRP